MGINHVWRHDIHWNIHIHNRTFFNAWKSWSFSSLSWANLVWRLLISDLVSSNVLASCIFFVSLWIFCLSTCRAKPHFQQKCLNSPKTSSVDTSWVLSCSCFFLCLSLKIWFRKASHVALGILGLSMKSEGNFSVGPPWHPEWPRNI